jgi:hypothetical protein
VDWNLDGDWDLISGDRNGYFNVFVWRDTGFQQILQYQKIDMTPMNVGANSYPFLVDWNGDNKRDLLLGSENGQVTMWKSMGWDTWPMFQEVETVQAAGSPINVYRVNPVVFDLDQDGVNDLICGENGGCVFFYRNIGTNEDPELAAAETLRTGDGLPLISRGTYTSGSRIWVGFWDADLVPDILLSAYDGNVELFRGQAVTGVAERPGEPARFAIGTGPNPFNTRVLIRCETVSGAELTVADGLGRTVRHLGTVTGNATRSWDGRNDAGEAVQSGVYFVRLTATDKAASSRLVLSR